MKKIEAIIRSSKFEEVRNALAAIGVNFFTIIDVKGYGLQKGQKMMYRGSIYDKNFIARIQLDILAENAKVDEIVKTIVHSARTGDIGDGKITVLDVAHITRIRTGETDESAI